ncbi:MAG: hypothetical protein JWO31_2832 [Phycisphaerales bacterium]|nr:hypothetical protein [Phycisphaerales bacterium]
MPLSSASTLAQVQAEYDDACGYFVDGDAALAKRFVVACMILLRKVPAETGTREAHVRYDPARVQQGLDEARAWLRSNAAGPGTGNPSVTRVDFTNFR